VLFVPIWDINPIKTVRFQYVTLLLILANVAVFFLFQLGLVSKLTEEQLAGLAMIPREVLGPRLFGILPVAEPPAASGFPEGLTLITYMFLHADLFHLLFNMVFLWLFGDNVEDAMGHLKFFVFYILCGIFAGLAHAMARSDSEIPLIGASGAVAGVIAAYLMLHPNIRVWVLVFYKIPFPLRFSAGFVLGLWIVLQVAQALLDDGGRIAWWAHIGGFAAGAILVLFMRRPGVPLFDRPVKTIP
jgi:membrane associated rhomboid family serine protease